MPALEFVNGWKEIAKYLGKGVRTVQRYELEMGLPIHRPRGEASSTVIASKAELDDWVLAGPTRAQSGPTVRVSERATKVAAKFLLVDSEIALTFSGIALGTSNEEKRRRTRRTARTAYDTIMRLRKVVNLSNAEQDKLDANLQRLRSELKRLDQDFGSLRYASDRPVA